MLVYANVCKCMQKLLSPTASPLRCGRLTFLTWSFRRWWDEFQIRGSQSEAGHFDNPMEVTVYPPRTKVHDCKVWGQRGLPESRLHSSLGCNSLQAGTVPFTDCLVPTTEFAGPWGHRDLISGPKEGLPAARSSCLGCVWESKRLSCLTPSPTGRPVKPEFQINKNERIFLA